MTLASRFAQLALDTRFDQLPQRAIEHAKVVIASTVASAAMGRSIDSARAFCEIAQERGGTPEATLWFHRGAKLPVMDVACANAVMSDAAASDDTDLAAAAHLGTVTAATAIAMGERTGASGRDVLSAIVAGYEIGHRIGERVDPTEVGFHPGVITIFSATVAAGKLMGLTHEQMTQAIALAATSIGGNRAAANASSAREYDAALSGLLAVTAVMAAHKGFTTETRVFEMTGGYFEMFAGHDIESVTDGWGESWGIVDDLAIKLMPCAWINHALVEAAWACAIEHDIQPQEVERIVVQGRGSARHMIYHPRDLAGVAHSLPYMVAAAVIDRRYSWEHVTPGKYLDASIGTLQEKVVASEQRSPHAKNGGGTVTIITARGVGHSKTFVAPRGSGPRGIEWGDIEDKYRALTPLAGMTPQNVEASLSAIRTLDDVSGVGALTALLQL